MTSVWSEYVRAVCVRTYELGTVKARRGQLQALIAVLCDLAALPAVILHSPWSAFCTFCTEQRGMSGHKACHYDCVFRVESTLLLYKAPRLKTAH